MFEFKKIIITPETKIIEAIDIIDKGGLQIALVCDEEGRLLGAITDGDIRRSILKRVSLEAPVSSAMNKSPTFVRVGAKAIEIQKIMAFKKINHIPILNDDGIVVGLDFDINVDEKLNHISAVIMAGGEGKRLYPLTKDIPKPMLKLGDKPMLELVIENLMSCGVREFFISVNYKSSIIKDYFGDGSSRDISIAYLEEENPLGTAGALSLLPSDLKRPFIVINGDVQTKVNFKKIVDFHSKHEALGTMCLKSFEMDVPYGVVELNDLAIEKIDEKPVQKFLVNAGIYVFHPDVRKYIPANERMDMTTLYMKLKNAGARVLGFPLHEYWVDVGRKSDLRRASSELASTSGNR